MDEEVWKAGPSVSTIIERGIADYAAAGEGAVEMTEAQNPPKKQNRGFSASLESAKNKGALSTFPPPRLRLLDWFRI
jgi:hypothetical protein